MSRLRIWPVFPNSSANPALCSWGNVGGYIHGQDSPIFLPTQSRNSAYNTILLSRIYQTRLLCCSMTLTFASKFILNLDFLRVRSTNSFYRVEVFVQKNALQRASFDLIFFIYETFFSSFFLTWTGWNAEFCLFFITWKLFCAPQKIFILSKVLI